MRLSNENKLFIESKKPKIAIIAPPLDSVPSASGNAIYTLVESIAKNSSFPIIIISINKSDNRICSSIENQIIYISDYYKKSIINAILGYRLSKRILNTTNLGYLKYYNQAYKIAKQVGIKVVVHEEFADLLFYISSSNLKIILHQHALNNTTNWNRIKNKIQEIIFVSERSKNIDNKTYKYIIKGEVIYNGLDLNNFPKKNKKKIFPNEIQFLYVGRINKEKGIVQLIRAFKTIENAKLSIVSDLSYSFGLDKTYLEYIKDEIANAPNITLLGKRLQCELKEEYLKSHFLICPSIGYEGLPKTITEAAVVGIPIVASDRGGITEIVRNNENGIIIQEPINEKNIINAIQNGIDNIENLTETAYQFSTIYRDKFNDKKMCQNFDNLFKIYFQR